MAFRLLTSHKALIFQVVSSSLNMDDAQACKTEIFNNKTLYSLIMFDLGKVQTFDQAALLAVAEVGKALQTDKTIRVMVIASEPLTKAIEANGLLESLPCYAGVVPVPMSDEKETTLPEIDALSFLKVTLPAIQENLKVYAKLDVTFDKPEICSQKNRPQVDIAGVGGFFCNHRKGSLMLCFKQDSYLKVVSAIMKKEFTKIEPGVSDWSAELVNSILGGVKTNMRNQGYSFSAGIPTVFIGKDLEVFYSTKLPPQLDMVRGSGSFGEFFVELILTQSE